MSSSNYTERNTANFESNRKKLRPREHSTHLAFTPRYQLQLHPHRGYLFVIVLDNSTPCDDELVETMDARRIHDVEHANLGPDLLLEPSRQLYGD